MKWTVLLSKGSRCPLHYEDDVIRVVINARNLRCESFHGGISDRKGYPTLNSDYRVLDVVKEAFR